MQKMFHTTVLERNESHILCPVYFSAGLAVLEVIKQT
jgi:hypothetical protein